MSDCSYSDNGRATTCSFSFLTLTKCFGITVAFSLCLTSQSIQNLSTKVSYPLAVPPSLLWNDPSPSPDRTPLHTIHPPASLLGCEEPASLHPDFLDEGHWEKTFSNHLTASFFHPTPKLKHNSLQNGISPSHPHPPYSPPWLACTCWFTGTHKPSATCWKVGWRSGKRWCVSSLHPCFFLCMWILRDGRKIRSRRSKSMRETQMRPSAHQRGTPIGPRIPPKRHPA